MLCQDTLVIVTGNAIISPFSLYLIPFFHLYLFFSTEEMHRVKLFLFYSFFLIKAVHYSLLNTAVQLGYTLLLWGGMAKDQHNLLAVGIFLLAPSEIQVVQELFGQSVLLLCGEMS